MITDMTVHGFFSGESIGKNGQRELYVLATNTKGKTNLHTMKALKFNVPPDLQQFSNIDVKMSGDVSVYIDFGKMVISCRELQIVPSKHA